MQRKEEQGNGIMNWDIAVFRFPDLMFMSHRHAVTDVTHTHNLRNLWLKFWSSSCSFCRFDYTFTGTKSSFPVPTSHVSEAASVDQMSSKVMQTAWNRIPAPLNVSMRVRHEEKTIACASGLRMPACLCVLCQLIRGWWLRTERFSCPSPFSSRRIDE